MQESGNVGRTYCGRQEPTASGTGTCMHEFEHVFGGRFEHVFRHMFRHVFRSVFRPVVRHVFRPAFRLVFRPCALFMTGTCACAYATSKASSPSDRNTCLDMCLEMCWDRWSDIRHIEGILALRQEENVAPIQRLRVYVHVPCTHACRTAVAKKVCETCGGRKLFLNGI